jgi:dipeptidyl-peptidase-3
MSKWLWIIAIGLALCVGACKKKNGSESGKADKPVEPVAALEPDPETQQKIDPQSEAEDAPIPAAADVVDDEAEDPAAQAPSPVEQRDEDFSLGTVDDVHLVRLFANRFSDLTSRKRALVYHLARAIYAGRDITFDQVHRDGLEVRQLIECVLRALPRLESDATTSLRGYLQKLGINSGFYDRWTGRKFVPTLDFEQFGKIVRLAHAEGAELNLQRDEQLEGMLARLRRTMFDPAHLPLMSSQRLNRAGEPLVGTFLNLYRGVTRAGLRKFEEHYPHNSRLINIDGALIEEVYRAGDKRRRIPPGRYARELRRVNKRLNDAISSADRAHRLLFMDLVEYFRTGDPFAFEAALRKWQEEPLDVEFQVGFLDRSWDPRGVKGLFAGLVGTRDAAASSKLESLVRHIQYFEDQMPWAGKLRRHWRGAPIIAAIDLVAGVADVAPACGFAFSLPPDRAIGERYARKVLLLSNVIEAHRRAVGVRIAREFTTGLVQARILEHLDETAFLVAALRELLGRNLGSVSAEVGSLLRGDLAAVEALKADLVALRLLADPKLIELGLLRGKDSAVAGRDHAVAQAVVMDALAGPDLQAPEPLGRRLWLRQLIEVDQVVGFSDLEGKPLPVILDQAKFAVALDSLLARSERILADADRQAARALVRQWADPSARPELTKIAERARAVGLRRTVAYVLPKLKPQRSPNSSRIGDATVSHAESLVDQLLRISRY